MKRTRGKRRRIWGTWKSWGRTEIGVFPICKPRRQNPSPGKSANGNVCFKQVLKVLTKKQQNKIHFIEINIVLFSNFSYVKK